MPPPISNAELISHQAQFSWEPHVKAGDYSFKITSTDGFTSDTTSFTISVHPEINLNENKKDIKKITIRFCFGRDN